MSTITKNKFSLLSDGDSCITKTTEKHVSPNINDVLSLGNTSITTGSRKHQVSQVVHNISNTHLQRNEIKLLEKGLNFCPSAKDPNKAELLDDIFSYCRNIRLKHYFHVLSNKRSASSEATTPSSTVVEHNELVERCEMKTRHKNPFFDPPKNFATPVLEKYLAATKSDILNLSNTPTNYSTNMSTDERNTLDSLKKRRDIIITRADKGGKVVVMDRSKYMEECTNQLDNEEFYIKLNTDPTAQITSELEKEIKSMENLIDKSEFQLITEFLNKSRMAIFYGLPKIHKKNYRLPSSYTYSFRI